MARSGEDIPRPFGSRQMDYHSKGEDLFNKLEGLKTKSLQLGLNELYDITVWDTEPGETYAGLYSLINDVSNFRVSQRLC